MGKEKQSRKEQKKPAAMTPKEKKSAKLAKSMQAIRRRSSRAEPPQ